jgi:hypothetical protein
MFSPATASAFLAWSFLLGPCLVEGIVFCGLIFLSRRIDIGDAARRFILVGLWTIAATIICYMIFLRNEAWATATHRRNVGIPLISIILWFQAVVLAPVFGWAFSRIKPKQS